MPSGIFDLPWTTGIGHLLAHPDAVSNLFIDGDRADPHPARHLCRCGCDRGAILDPVSLQIFGPRLLASSAAMASGVLFAKLINRVSSKPVNPILIAAGVSAVSMAARVAMITARKGDSGNFLIMHALAPDIGGATGSAVAAGELLALLGS